VGVNSITHHVPPPLSGYKQHRTSTLSVWPQAFRSAGFKSTTDSGQRFNTAEALPIISYLTSSSSCDKTNAPVAAEKMADSQGTTNCIKIRVIMLWRVGELIIVMMSPKSDHVFEHSIANIANIDTMGGRHDVSVRADRGDHIGEHS
jgi:hypothetical protein